MTALVLKSDDNDDDSDTEESGEERERRGIVTIVKEGVVQ